MELDELLLPMHEYIQELIHLNASMLEDEETGVRLYPESVSIEMPLEMQIDPAGRAEDMMIGAAPPIYYANTSIQPVFHRIQVNIRLQP